MNNAGIFTLGDVAITAAATYITDWVDGLDGVSEITYDLNFAWGSGGSSGKVFLQTSLRQAIETTDAGIDIACMSFAGASKQRVGTLVSGYKAATIPTDGLLTEETDLSGVLGDRFRLKIVTIGVYAGNTILSGRIAAR